ncbi:MAG: DUF3267 domain-containing protein [Bacteroidales bacterium]
MRLSIEDLSENNRFRQIKVLPYSEISEFVFENILHSTAVTAFYWASCLLTLGTAVIVIINIGGYFSFGQVLLHALLGLMVFPLLVVPVHEILHIIPYFVSGARDIRYGFEPGQFAFFVTAHRYVARPVQFILVAFFPFIVLTVLMMFLILYLPGLWKWSLSLFLFVHTTMCAGDFAMANFYWINRDGKIYTWDDADSRVAYFYKENKTVNADN